MKIDAEEAEIERQKKRQIDLKECKEGRMVSKLKKRNLNIEIASQIVDLVMDVSDEAFDLLYNNT